MTTGVRKTHRPKIVQPQKPQPKSKTPEPKTPAPSQDKVTIGDDPEEQKKNAALKSIDAKQTDKVAPSTITPSKPKPDEISPERKMQIDADPALATWPTDVLRTEPAINTKQVAATLRGEGAAGKLSEAEQRYVMNKALDQMIDTKVDPDRRSTNYAAMRALRDEAMNDPSIAPAVSQAYAERSAEMMQSFKNGTPAYRDERALASTLAAESMLAAGNTERRAALLDRLGPDRSVLLSNALVTKPEDDPTDGNAAFLGASDNFDSKNLAEGQLLTAAAANALYGNDPAKLAKEGARLDEVLNTGQGQQMLSNYQLTLEQKYVNAGLILAHPEWDAAFMKQTSSPYDNPQIAQALAAPTAKSYAQRGDTPQILNGTNLENTIGYSMGFPPVVPENETPEQRAAREQAVAEGRYSYYSSGPGAEAVTPVAESIRKIGGAEPKVTVIPVQFASNESGAVQLPLFRVQDPATFEDRYVDNRGRTYQSFEDWKENNQLPPGSMTYPPGGHITPDAKMETKATPKTVDTPGEYVTQALDYAALVGGTIAGGAMIVGSGGMLAPVVVAGASAWGAYRNISSLNDRYEHGQTLNPLQSSEARAEWLGLGANVLGFASIGGGSLAAKALQAESRFAPALTTGASALTVGANVMDTASAVNNAGRLVANWDELSGQERASLALSLGFWGTGTFARTRMNGGGMNELYSYRAIKEGLVSANVPSTPGRVFEGFTPRRLVIGGGNDPSFPKLGKNDVSVNLDPGAKPTIVADGNRLPLADESMGQVLVENVALEDFARKGMISESYRVLKANGSIRLQTGGDSGSRRQEIEVNRLVTEMMMSGYRDVNVTREYAEGGGPNDFRYIITASKPSAPLRAAS